MPLKVVLLIFNLFLILGGNISAQTKDTTSWNDLPLMESQNKLNAKGKKTGLWKENGGLIEANYVQGQKDGAYKEYYKKNHVLKSEGFYKKGHLTGNWKYYDKKGLLSVTVDSIVENDSIDIADGHMGQLRPPHKGYLKDYYKDGSVKNEGPALFDDPVMHYYKIATWKFYDKKGLMVKQELYKKPKPV